METSDPSQVQDSVVPDLLIDDETRARIRRALQARFEAGTRSGKWPGCYGSGHRIRLEPDQLPVPPLVRWMLADFIGAPDMGAGEKLAWQCRFKFDGRECSLAQEKFGLYVYVDDSDLNVDHLRVAQDIVARLQKAIGVAERAIFAPYAEHQIRDGRVTVVNQQGQLRQMYEHFRREAENPDPPSDADFGDGLIAPLLNRRLATERRRFFNGVAMVNAYFSWLEHVFVLVWPFCNYRPGIDDLEGFIGKRWSEKLKLVFDVTSSGTNKTMLDKLRDVAEEYRNTYGHGGFDKHRGALVVHTPAGAMPAMMSRIRETPRLEFSPISEPALQSLGDLFDGVDDWLETGSAKYGLTYVQSGLDVPFSEDWITQARSAMASDEAFDDFVGRNGYEYERMVNMDW